jgi:hypothetical protein
MYLHCRQDCSVVHEHWNRIVGPWSICRTLKWVGSDPESWDFSWCQAANLIERRYWYRQLLVQDFVPTIMWCWWLKGGMRKRLDVKRYAAANYSKLKLLLWPSMKIILKCMQLYDFFSDMFISNFKFLISNWIEVNNACNQTVVLSLWNKLQMKWLKVTWKEYFLWAEVFQMVTHLTYNLEVCS